MTQKLAPTSVPIDPVLAKRWSTRAFDRDRDLNSTQILALIEAARWAPSCYGDQPWYFIFCHKTTHPESWQRAWNTLNPFNQAWVEHAPLIIFSLARATFHHNEKPNRWSHYDTGAATENLCLQATAMHLASHQMGGYDTDAVIQVFQVPKNHFPMAAIAIGYPKQADHLPTELQQSERQARERHPIEQHFFMGEWGRGFQAV